MLVVVGKDCLTAKNPLAVRAVAPLAIYKGADGQQLALVNQNALGGAAILMGIKKR